MAIGLAFLLATIGVFVTVKIIEKLRSESQEDEQHESNSDQKKSTEQEIVSDIQNLINYMFINIPNLPNESMRTYANILNKILNNIPTDSSPPPREISRILKIVCSVMGDYLSLAKGSKTINKELLTKINDRLHKTGLELEEYLTKLLEVNQYEIDNYLASLNAITKLIKLKQNGR